MQDFVNIYVKGTYKVSVYMELGVWWVQTLKRYLAICVWACICYFILLVLNETLNSRNGVILVYITSILAGWSSDPYNPPLD